MAGLQGLSGWRWIFIIEGVLSCCVGMSILFSRILFNHTANIKLTQAAFFGYVFFVGFPDDGKTYKWFLTPAQTQFIIDRVNADRSDAVTEPFTLGRFLKGGLDLKIWGYAMIFFDTTTITYSLAYFLPLILEHGMGFSTGAAQCLIAPPYVFAGIVMYIMGWAGDKWRIRGPFIIINMIMCIIGLALMGFVTNIGARYFGVFLAAAGANANVPMTMAYQANNIRGQWKRAFCSATLVGFGG